MGEKGEGVVIPPEVSLRLQVPVHCMAASRFLCHFHFLCEKHVASQYLPLTAFPKAFLYLMLVMDGCTHAAGGEMTLLEYLLISLPG